MTLFLLVTKISLQILMNKSTASEMSVSTAKSKTREVDFMILAIIMIVIIGVKSSELEVFVNNSAYILCSANKSMDIQWHFDSYYTYVYAGGRFFIPYRGRFQLEYNVSAAAYNLTIPNVQLEDTGWYYCSEEITGYQISVTHLTVLHVSPVCSSNMHPDGFIGPNTCKRQQQENMIFTCDVSFNGRPPYLIWRSADDSLTICTLVCDLKLNRIICNLTLESEPSYDGKVFICDAIGPNVPTFSCSTEAIKVQHFLADYKEIAKKVHENARCEVTSNAFIKYNWTLNQINEYTFLSGNETILIEKPGIHKCGVEYDIRNETFSATVSTVNVSADSAEDKDYGINVLAVTFPIVAVVIIVIAAVFFCYIKRRERRLRGELLENQEQELRQLLEEQEREQDLSERKRENKRIKNRVIEMYKEFVTYVDPKDILDLLIQKRVIDIEFKEELMAKETREDRCRALLDHLLESSKYESFIVLREALKEDRYHKITEAIDTSDETGGICNPASVKFLKKLRFPAFSFTTFIHGITKLPNRIYVLCSHPKYVVVFNDRMPFEFLDTIRIEEIEYPYDIASSRKSECLYIVDLELKTIWEKKTTDDSPLTQWSVDLVEPYTLSISIDDRLLVLDGSRHANLVIFGLDGKLIQRISLPNEIQDPLHCIEKPNGGFIISEECTIIELSSDGKDIIRRYLHNDASEVLLLPCYMSLDYDNALLFVADLSKRRVIIIDSNSLKLKDIIITELMTPCRLLYDSNKSQLIVSQQVDGVNVYKLTKTTN